MRDMEQRAFDAYREQFGTPPEMVTSAPGRVNLIGEHTDYNDGFVLPCAIERRVAVAVGRGEGRLYSADFNELRDLAGDREDAWTDYPRGVVWALAERGHTTEPFNAAYAGDVPLGGGLSSSAAIEAATALALNELFALGLERTALAAVCQRSENGFVGVNSGIMDQYASLLCGEGEALLVDCRSLEARSIPLDLDGAGLALVVCDTRVERKLGATGYNDRRSTCEAAAKALGVDALRDATIDDLGRLSGKELQRARHVVSENLRVQEAAHSLENGEFDAFGRLMVASHLSLRDDYEVSVPELDAFVQCALDAGALGARLTGAGFGGCAIALIDSARTGDLEEAVRRRFQGDGLKEPAIYVFRAAAGAERVL